MLKPESRPLPIRIFNVLTRTFALEPKLDFDKIIKKAKSKTGLSHLGKDFNDISLRKIIEAANKEAMLHPFGKLMLKEKLVSQLENRLWAEYWFKKHPHILEQELLPVILITGLQRTGTTRMQRLLSALKGARSLCSWEALYPAPIECEKETSRRIRRTERNEKAVRWISPVFQSIHPIHTHEPEEDVLLLDVHFMSSSVEAILNVPQYSDWLSNQNHEEAYQYEIKLLKLLQWQQGGDYWVLKSPHHLEYLDIVNKLFPEVMYIWMHRSLAESIPSFLSMLFYSRSMFSPQVSKDSIKSHWLNKLRTMLKAGLKFRSQHPAGIKDVHFDDFIGNEYHTVENLMKELDYTPIPVMPQRDTEKQQYVSEHNYELRDWGLSNELLNRQFDFYSKEFFPKTTTGHG